MLFRSPPAKMQEEESLHTQHTPTYQRYEVQPSLSDGSEVTQPPSRFSPTEADMRNFRKLVAACPDGYFGEPHNYGHFKTYLNYALKPYEERYLVFSSTLEKEAWVLKTRCLERGIDLYAYEPNETNTVASTIWAVNKFLQRKGPDIDDVMDPTMSKLPNIRRLCRKIEGLKLEGRGLSAPQPTQQQIMAQQKQEEKF